MKRLISSGMLMAGMSIVTSSPLQAEEPAHPDKPSAEAIEYFEKHVRPLLVGKCYNCHSADNKAAGGLRVDDRNGLLQGGGRGPAVVPGAIEKSVLLKAISHTDEKLKMPPEFKLEDGEIAILTKWVQDGAAWPSLEIPANLLKDDAEYDKLRQSHWAWQPLKSVTVPEVRDTAWARSDVDRFVLAKLESESLAPVADADRSSLLRRITYDLTGLPPTPEEQRAFLNDTSPQAYELVVDRLLQSTAFGERWGRHWLDIARFGESTGSARNLPYPNAWRYRDYVIDALNKDKPYDQFVREQIAGDLLPYESEEQHREQNIATGFLAIGVKDVNQRFKVRFTMDNIDEQIDTFSQAFLGLTVSCARCHDHKFDPISTKEYYGIAGIFHSTDLCAGVRNKMGGGGLDYYDPSMLLILSKTSQPGPEHEAKVAAAKKAADDAKAEFEALRDSEEGSKPAPNGRPKRQVARRKWNRLQGEYTALTDPAATGDVALGLREAKQIGDTEVRIRGEAEKLGPVVPRGFLKAVTYPGQPVIPADKSGRLELAQWITSPQNPLTSRVIVNRVWQHLFGNGLVKSVDNFGVTGDTPSHPELLDFLATKFVQDGWSVKHLVRSLALTRAYQLGSAATEEHLTRDPANRLVWRHSPRRLDAEELRDSILMASNTLDRQPPKGSAAQALRVIELRNNGPESQQLTEIANHSKARSVYLPLLRTLVPGSLEVFDFADQGLVSGQRETTTVPTQSLYLLNDTLVRKNSLSFAESLLTRSEIDDRVRVEQAYSVTVGRTPTTQEVDRALAFVKDYEALAAELLQSEFNSIAQREQEARDKEAAAAAQAVAAVDQPSQPGSTTPEANAAVPATEPVTGTSPADQALADAQQRAANAVNPDDVEQTDAVVKEEVVQAHDARTAAWSSFIQALFASGEFRYLP